MNERSLRVLLFDLGGTLMYEKDPWLPIYARAEQAMRASLETSKIVLGPGVYGPLPTFLHFYNDRREQRSDMAEVTSTALLKELLEANGFADAPKAAIESALRAMYAVTQTNWIPEDDALPTLQVLKEQGYRIGLISNAADDENTQTLIDKGSFRPLVEFIVSSAACGVRKPDPRIFQLALDHFEIAPSEAAMIGDALDADVLGANQLGMFSIWLTRRAQPKEGDRSRIKPNAQATSLHEIPELLGRL